MSNPPFGLPPVSQTVEADYSATLAEIGKLTCEQDRLASRQSEVAEALVAMKARATTIKACLQTAYTAEAQALPSHPKDPHPQAPKLKLVPPLPVEQAPNGREPPPA